MEKIILDTDIFIDYFRGVSESERYIENLPVDKRGTTDVTLMELFSGARDKKHLATIVEFIETNLFSIFPYGGRELLVLIIDRCFWGRMGVLSESN